VGLIVKGCFCAVFETVLKEFRERGALRCVKHSPAFDSRISSSSVCAENAEAIEAFHLIVHV